jgi:hypothetical protein
VLPHFNMGLDLRNLYKIQDKNLITAPNINLF